MQDQDTNATGDAARRVVVCVLSLAGVAAAALAVPMLGWTAGLGMLAAATLVLVVVLLAIAPDDAAAEGASDPSP